MNEHNTITPEKAEKAIRDWITLNLMFHFHLTFKGKRKDGDGDGTQEP